MNDDERNDLLRCNCLPNNLQLFPQNPMPSNRLLNLRVRNERPNTYFRYFLHRIAVRRDIKSKNRMKKKTVPKLRKEP